MTTRLPTNSPDRLPVKFRAQDVASTNMDGEPITLTACVDAKGNVYALQCSQARGLTAWDLSPEHDSVPCRLVSEFEAEAIPVNATTWGETEARAGFLCCAMQMGRDAAESLVVGAEFQHARGAFKALGLVDVDGLCSTFTSGYLMQLKAAFPGGVPVTYEGSLVAEAGQPGTVRVIGVGLIG